VIETEREKRASNTYYFQPITRLFKLKRRRISRVQVKVSRLFLVIETERKKQALNTCYFPSVFRLFELRRRHISRARVKVSRLFLVIETEREKINACPVTLHAT